MSWLTAVPEKQRDAATCCITRAERQLRERLTFRREPLFFYARAGFGLCAFPATIPAGGERVAKGKYEEWLTDDGLLLIAAWARDGLTLEQIAHNTGVADSTFREWRERFPAIATALKISRELADIEVENALYKRAIGYEYEEETIEDGPKGMRIIHTKKKMAPDVTAQIFWLKNRKTDVWRDRKDVALQEADGKETGVVELAEVKGDA